ncbi:hypothetical protein SAMN02910265_00239 [Ruminococcus flavefaciens]|uniref:5-bromo-4-chloroindolyl phosphate hydrolysis protein n=1 Tax=Ruminococcus flavefaciens TaxID=1265 RepID=A0A1H6HWC5_RUMFL|nr:hypothetical protein [Ruminococcus flavefaciens]SEH38480.1 hypothetical protein SAMN02910265_00239 [Ruminococcus flavefaciens]
MKKYFGQIVFNVTVAIMSVLLFGCTDLLDSAVLSILAIIATVALLSWGNYYFIKIASLGRKAFQRAYILDEHTFESLNQPEDYLQVMKDLKDYAPCRQEAARLIDQWEAFQKKSVTLNTISDGAGVYELVNQDIQSVMLSNMLLFMKRTAIIQSASHNGELNMHKDYLRMLTGRNEKILNDYTNLLIEVSQLTDSERKNTEIKSLSLIIESIHDYKKEMESEDI